MKQLLLFLTLFASAALASDTPSQQHVLDVQVRYQNLLLKMRGVEYVTTALCEEESGRLVTGAGFAGLESPLIDCVAVHVESALDLRAIKRVYGNPLIMEGVLIHFSVRDPLPPNKGGITVHN